MAKKSLDVLINARDQISKKLGLIGKSVTGLNRTFQGAAGAIGVYFSGRALLQFTRNAVNAYEVQSRAETKLEAVLRATGGAAGWTAEQLKEQAAALQQVTGIGDEATINTQALLATFKQIKGDVFKEATQAVLDMNSVMSGSGTESLQGAAVQIGKALNDPIKGVSALQRVGVTFTDAQKKMIGTMVDSGNTMGAQKLILAELKSEFGGAAEAWGETSIGRLEKFKGLFGDTTEELGEAIANSDLLKTALEKASSALQTGGSHFDILANSGLLAIEQVTGSVEHFAGTAVPHVLDQMATQWKEIFDNLGDNTLAFFKNLWENIEKGHETKAGHWFSDKIAELRIMYDPTTTDLQKGKALSYLEEDAKNRNAKPFEWKPLTAGMVDPLKDLPPVPPRVKSELEKAYAAQLVSAEARLAEAKAAAARSGKDILAAAGVKPPSRAGQGTPGAGNTSQGAGSSGAATTAALKQRIAATVHARFLTGVRGPEARIAEETKATRKAVERSAKASENTARKIEELLIFHRGQQQLAVAKF